MLTFSLKNLKIYISQRADGDFRQHQTIEHFFKNKQLITNHCQFLYLQLENNNQQVVIDEKQIANKKNQLLKGDAIISNFKKAAFQKNEREANQTLISMVLGDCFPLIFFDQKSQNIAMIHAGWEPLYLGILDQVWQTMLNLWQTTPQQIWAFLGPGIRAESYWVANQPRQSQTAHWQKYIKKQQKHVKKQPFNQQQNQLTTPVLGWQIDLPGFIKDFLDKQNFPKQQLIDCQLDTYILTDEFFSYHRSQELLAKGEDKAAQLANGRYFVTCQLFI